MDEFYKNPPPYMSPAVLHGVNDVTTKLRELHMALHDFIALTDRVRAPGHHFFGPVIASIDDVATHWQETTHQLLGHLVEAPKKR